MLLHILSGFTPGIYPDNSNVTTIWILIAVVIVLAILAFVFFTLFLYFKFNGKTNKNDTLQKQINLSAEELDILKKYNKLNKGDKHAINQMLNSLDNNSLNKE